MGYGNQRKQEAVPEFISENEAAIRLYEKAGYVIEGVLKKQINLDGEYQDLILMGKILGEG